MKYQCRNCPYSFSVLTFRRAEKLATKHFVLHPTHALDRVQRLHFHSQNLNHKPLERYGWKLRHGRAWLNSAERNFGANWEWHFFRRSSTIAFSIGLATGESSAISGNIQLAWFGALYWGIGIPRLRRWLERVTSKDKEPQQYGDCVICGADKYKGHTAGELGCLTAPGMRYRGARSYWRTSGRDIGFRIHDGALWLELWNDPMEWSSRDPKWWHYTIHPMDLIFGRMKHSDGIVFDKQDVLIPTPEGGYPATITMREEVWKRPRWFAKKLRRAHIEMKEGFAIPFPGKGESEWDCGEDATHSMCCVADSVLDGMIAMTRSVMQSRIRYGGHNWVPQGRAKSA